MTVAQLIWRYCFNDIETAWNGQYIDTAHKLYNAAPDQLIRNESIIPSEAEWSTFYNRGWISHTCPLIDLRLS